MPPVIRAAPGVRTARGVCAAVAACVAALGLLAAASPWVAVSAQRSAVKLTEIVNERASYPQCHASTIAEAAPGQLVAAWFGGTRERAPDVGIWVARRGTSGWLDAVEVASGLQPDGSRHPTWNPVLFQAPRGPLVLFYKVGPSPREWWGMMTSSSDRGRTWSSPRRLPDGILGPIKNKPLALSDGTWVSPSSTESESSGWNVRFELTRDGGNEWDVVGPVARGADELEAIQPSLFVHPGGRLQAVCRTRNGVLAATWSEDRGRTWSPLAKTTLPNPNSGTDGITLADGRHLLVYNHSTLPPGKKSGGLRHPLNVALSADGVQWTMVLTLEDQPMPDGYAYPTVIQAADGLVHVTYTWNRQRIKHVVIDPTELKE